MLLLLLVTYLIVRIGPMGAQDPGQSLLVILDWDQSHGLGHGTRSLMIWGPSLGHGDETPMEFVLVCMVLPFRDHSSGLDRKLPGTLDSHFDS